MPLSSLSTFSLLTFGFLVFGPTTGGSGFIGAELSLCLEDLLKK
jgi:hypothetical protein